MSNTSCQKPEKQTGSGHEWLWEILIVVSVVPAAVYGVVSLGQLPIV